MKSNINLLSSSQIEMVRQGRGAQVLRILAIAAVSFISISSIVIFFVIKNLSPSEVKKQEEVVLKNISQLSSKEEKLLLVTQKLKDVRKIMASRPKYDEILAVLVGTVPDDVAIGTLEIDSEKINLSVSSKSLSSINTLIDSLLNMVREDKTIKSVTIENVSVDVKTGNYSMTVTGIRI